MTLLQTDRALLHAFRRGEAQALRRVYDAYRNRVERLLRAGAVLGGGRFAGVGRTECADLMQEVFARAFGVRARLAYDGLNDYGPFLFGICRHVLAEWWRQRGREVPSEDIDTLLEAEAPAFSDLADLQELAIAKAYIDSLPRELAAVHEQRYVKGLSQRDAADALGLGRQRLRTLEEKLQSGLRTLLQQPKGRAGAKDFT